MNLSSQTAHLSEESLDSILLGFPSPADERHLATCQACAGRIAGFRTALAGFNQASAGWCEARSNTIPRELPPPRVSHTRTAVWSFASVTLLAVAFAITNQPHRSAEFVDLGGQGAQQASNRQQEIANDNAMLVAIDSELSEPVRSPVVANEMRVSVAPGTRQISPREVHD